MFSLNSQLNLGLVLLLSLGLFNSANAECPCNRGGGAFNSSAPLSPVAAPVYQASHTPHMQYSQPAYSYGHGGINNVQIYSGFPQQSSGYMNPSGQGYPTGMIGNFSQAPMVSPYSSNYAPRSNPTPPPGTIGQTFKLPSRPVPVEKHPRVGMLDVKISDAHDVIVHDMNAMRTEDTIDGFKDAKLKDVWHFESKPLYPGLDHIYRVQATFKNPDGSERNEEKYVRLIMGRVVELTF